MYFAFTANDQGNTLKARFNQQFKALWDAGKVNELMMKEVGDSGSLPEKQPD
ncbi:hypothetical protein [Lacimicrobium sp. SS2-24]|uniref:hypothetical protein n=1 Tax=Lacimicrobium sp. SS2-24 TaxID=2005569 RepID=UPI001439BD8F|nr:hypothetical protein [Lacimicrobium sp. SS2-24]